MSTEKLWGGETDKAASNAPLHVAALLHAREIIVFTVVHVDRTRVCLQMHISTIIQAKRTNGIQASLLFQSELHRRL